MLGGLQLNVVFHDIVGGNFRHDKITRVGEIQDFGFFFRFQFLFQRFAQRLHTNQSLWGSKQETIYLPRDQASMYGMCSFVV